MSFIHSTIVGHFDPATLTAINRSVLRPLDIESAKLLLADFDAHVATQIAFHDGYVECWWADGNFGCSKPTHDYAYRLAETLNCVAAETPVCYITFPEAAKQIQANAWEKWRQENPPLDGRPQPPPIFSPPKPAPCPYCGEPLRTSIAQQCRHCKMDWHNPNEVCQLGTNRG